MSRALSILSLVLFSGALASGCGRGEHTAREAGDRGAPIPVDAALAAGAEWQATTDLTAGIEPWRRAAPGTVLMGRVVALGAREGDRVAAGAELARIDSRDVAAKVAQARAGVEAARAQEANARRMRERMERLYPKQAASQSDLDNAVAAHEGAKAALDAAEEGVHAAEAMLEYGAVRAPFAGVVAERHVELGDMAAPGMPLFVIEDLSKVKVVAEAAESLAAGLAVGDAVEVTALGETRTGTVHEILPTTDPRSRTVEIRVLLDNPDRRLRSGGFARIALPGPPETTIAVDVAAIVRRGPLTGVFVVDESNTARLRWIDTGRERDGQVEVLAGLDPGDRYVTGAAPGLVDGAPVEVR